MNLLNWALVPAAVLAFLLLPVKAISKDVQLIEDKYPYAAGYHMKALKRILYVVAALIIPVWFFLNLYLTDRLSSIYNSSLLLCAGAIGGAVLLCAVTEAIMLNRGQEKHRVLPWVLAAINIATAAVYLLLFNIWLWLGPLFDELISSTDYSYTWDWYQGVVMSLAGYFIVLQLTLLAKELVFRVCFKVKLRLLGRRLLFIGVNLLVVSLQLI